MPPTFLQGFNFSGDIETVPGKVNEQFLQSSNKLVDFYGKQRKTLRWDGEDSFKYWTDATTGDDVQFQDGPTTVVLSLFSCFPFLIVSSHKALEFWKHGGYTPKSLNVCVAQ